MQKKCIKISIDQLLLLNLKFLYECGEYVCLELCVREREKAINILNAVEGWNYTGWVHNNVKIGLYGENCSDNSNYDRNLLMET